jgi:hypothetical protein
MRFQVERCLSCGTAVKPSDAKDMPDTDFWFCSSDCYANEILERMPEKLYGKYENIFPDWGGTEEDVYQERLRGLSLSIFSFKDWEYKRNAREYAKMIVQERKEWNEQRSAAMQSAKQQIYELCVAEQRLLDNKAAEKQQREMKREVDKQTREAERQTREAERKQRELEKEAEREAEEDKWKPKPFKL